MTEYIDGKAYRIKATGARWDDPHDVNGFATFRSGGKGDRFEYEDGTFVYYPSYEGFEYDIHEIDDEPNAIDPEHYRFSGGVQVVDISEHLTANAAQALQYIARSSRIDGRNKGNTIEDLTKAIWFLDRELLRKKEAQ